MSASDAMKKAWSEVEHTSAKSSKQVKRHLWSIGKSAKHVSGELGGLRSVLGKLVGVIGSAFAVHKVVEFGKEAVRQANAMTDALIGLRSVLEGQGRSFRKAKGFINDYIADGLVPATNAITAYKNLALRGYNDQQIQQVLVALKDSAAFGRQASYSMGEAVQSASEGLKNENSILVDNAGVTKNVAKMWEDYAHSIGTTANNLTQQQKIQAEVNGILEESKYQAGDAAKVAGTYSGQLMQLSFSFTNLKIAVGNAIIPIAQKVLPIINSMIAGLTRLANAAAAVVGALFGKASVNTGTLASNNEAVASSAGAGAAAEDQLAKSTQKAGKAAKGALASFDELNVLQQDTAGGGTNTAPAGGGVSAGSVPITAELEVEDTLSPQLQAIVDKIRQLVQPLQAIDFGPLAASFDRLKEAAAPLTHDLFAGLEWAYYNLFVPLASWTIEDALPAFLDVFAGGLRVLTAVLEALAPLGQWLWDNFLQPIASWTGGVIVDVLNLVADGLDRIADWISENQTAVQVAAVTVAAFMAAWKGIELATALINLGGLSGLFTGLTAKIWACTAAKLADKALDLQIIALYAVDFVQAIGTAVVSLATSTAAWIAETASKAASTAATWAQIAATTVWNGICALATTVTTAFGAALNFLAANPIVLVIAAIGALIAIVVLMIRHWDQVKEVLHNLGDWLMNTFVWVWTNVFGTVIQGVMDAFFSSIGDIVAGIKRVFEGIVEFIGGVFTGDWASAWNGIKNIFGGVFESLIGLAKTPINTIIGFVNSMIQAVMNGINAVIGAMNRISVDIPGWVPGFGGKHFGINIPTLSAPQIPMLAQGAVLPANHPFLAMVGDQKNGTNIEAPLDTIKQALAEVLAQMPMQEREIVIKFAASGGLEQLVRLLKPYIDKENHRVGTRLITGGEI